MINNLIFNIKVMALILLPFLLGTFVMLVVMAYLVHYIPYPLVSVPIGILLFVIIMAGIVTWIEWLADHNIL